MVLGVLEALPLASAQAQSCANNDPLRQPFFGDLHAHTSYSLDADTQGTRLEPDDAYAFAQGATVGIQPHDAQGTPLRQLTIDRPLDFAMVADHAEFFGEISLCRDAVDPPQGSLCWYYQELPEAAFFIFNIGLSASLGSATHNPDLCGPDGQLCTDQAVTFWNEIQAAADNANDQTSACSFTSFIGYEWTGSPGARNLHRNVVFRNSTVPSHATSYFEASYPESLWDALENDCVGNCEFLTIPHNSNLSSGQYFLPVDRFGNTYTSAVAARRALHEPIIEVMQHKGQSECIPGSSPSDEFCDYETMPGFSTLAGPGFAGGGPQKPEDFVREALKEGQTLHTNLGVNPFKYGMIGSTDTHLGTPGAVSEENYPGHGGAGAAAATQLPPGLTDNWYYNPGGLAVVWAEENSRDSLFDAMRRREVYATSGSRPIVRVFAGQLDSDLCSNPNAIADAYSQGVPMGSDMPSPPMFEYPSFYVHVQKDPQGADLQQVELVRVIGGAGIYIEEVVEIAGDADNGASVDLNTCQPQGTGFSELCTVFTDYGFWPYAPSFYYVRVIENPTCRWNQHQCVAAGVDCNVPATITQGFEPCCDENVPKTVQERAWTSPIWHRPYSAEPTFTMAGSNFMPKVCAGGALDTMTIAVEAEPGFTNPVTLAGDNLPAGIDISFVPNPVAPGNQTTALITADVTVAHDDVIPFVVRGTASAAGDWTMSGGLAVFDSVPVAPTLNMPADGEVDVARKPVFTFSLEDQVVSHVLELSRDPAFATIDVTANPTGYGFSMSSNLLGNTTYYWRVRGENPCGQSASSATFSFTTEPAPPWQPCSSSIAEGPMTSPALGFLGLLLIYRRRRSSTAKK